MDSPYKYTEGWIPFGISKEEAAGLFVDFGTLIIETDALVFSEYPFRPSIVYTQPRVLAISIVNIDIEANPPTLQIERDLVFVPAKEKDRILMFAYANQIPIVKRADIWSWILEPFLDTEYTDDMHSRLTNMLSQLGLSEKQVLSIRKEVEVQMLKYNFDTVLWEWVHLGLWDALSAMQPKYNNQQFEEFYQRAIAIALLPDTTIL